jgi:putative membrane protein
MPKPETRPGTAPPNADPILMEADRTLLLIINTSLTMIGFGFTINELFGNAAGKGPNVDVVGRILGLSLLSLGLILLAFGIHWHAALVRQLTGRAGRLSLAVHLTASRRYHYSPIFAVAVLLLTIGVLTLGAVIFGMIRNG